MNGRRTPAVAYITHLIKTTSKKELNEILNESPLKPQEIDLILRYINGASYKELAEIFHKSTQRINQWKRTVYEKLHYFIVNSEIF